jgi:hypothetical protein
LPDGDEVSPLKNDGEHTTGVRIKGRYCSKPMNNTCASTIEAQYMPVKASDDSEFPLKLFQFLRQMKAMIDSRQIIEQSFRLLSTQYAFARGQHDCAATEALVQEEPCALDCVAEERS